MKVGGKLNLLVDLFLYQKRELLYATSEVDDSLCAFHVYTPSVVVPLEVLRPIAGIKKITFFFDGRLTSAFAMNNTAVIVASEVASSPGKRSLISLIDSSMCFLCTIMSRSPKSADIHNKAWKSAASVMTSGYHAVSLTLLSGGSMAAASIRSNSNSTLAVALIMPLER